MLAYRHPISRRYFIDQNRYGGGFWCYPSVIDQAQSRFVCESMPDAFGPPPSETLRTLIECGAPWYAVLDKFVEEYPQWEEVLAWAPTANSEATA